MSVSKTPVTTSGPIRRRCRGVQSLAAAVTHRLCFYMSETTEEEDTSPDPTPWDRNTEMRRRYIELQDELSSLDDQHGRKARRIRWKLDHIANEFAAANDRLARHFSRKVLRGKSGDEDCLQAARLGLWQAFLRWDPDKGTFGTWSKEYISGNAMRAARWEQHPELSYADSNVASRVLAEAARWRTEHGRDATPEELAQIAGCGVGSVKRILTPKPKRLDASAGSEGDATLGDLIADISDGGGDPADFFDAFEAEAELPSDVVAELSALELVYFLRRIGADGLRAQNRNQIGALFGLGREHLRVGVEARLCSRLGISEDDLRRVGADTLLDQDATADEDAELVGA